MNIADVTRACIGAGFEGDALVEIVAIAGRESNWSEAVADTRRFTEHGPDGIWRDPQTGDELPRGIGPEYSVGPFQINLNVHPLTYDQAMDAPTAAAYAYQLSEGGRTFSAWSTSAGLPETFRDQAREAIAVAQEDPDAPALPPVAPMFTNPRVNLDSAQAKIALSALGKRIAAGDPLQVVAGPDAGQVTIIGTVERDKLAEAWPALADILPAE